MNTKSNLLKSIFISLILVMGVANMSAETITSDGTARLYFNKEGETWWDSDNAVMSAYFFKDSSNKFAGVAKQHSGDTYYVFIPSGTWSTVILTRHENGTTTPTWDNKWNQTGDISLSSSSNYISDFNNSSNSVTWGTEIKPASTGSLSASSTSVNIGANVTLTPSLTSNQTINDIKSTSYSFSPNSGASISGNTFTATKAGTYTVTATITYNPDGYTSLTSTVKPTVTITVNPWTITWNANGGSVSPATSEYDGATAVSLPTPTRTGHNFDGWYTAASGGTKINDVGTTTKPTGNVTYYAHWTPKTYAITLNANGGASNGSATATYNSSSITNITHPTRTDYRCNGYYTAASGGTLVLNTDGTLAKSVSGYTDANGNWTKDGTATLYAQWTQIEETKYAVTISSAGNGTVSPSGEQQIGASGMEVTATPATGYEFDRWANTAGAKAVPTNTAITTVSATAAGTITAHFKAKTYAITLNANGGSGNTASVTATYNSSTLSSAITNPTKAGYTFAGWYSGAGGTGSMVINTSGVLQANISTYTGANGIWIKDNGATLYAKWTANTYTVSLDNQDATTAGATSVTATYGSAMPSIANNLPTKTGYTFGGYYTATDGGGTQYYKTDGTSAQNWTETSVTKLYAKWTPNTYTITYKDKDNANFSGTHASGYPTTHTYGTETTLKDATKSGYTFDGWFTASDCSGSAVTSLGATAYTADITLYAKWTEIPPTTVYLEPNDNWKKDNARFAVYCWNSSGNIWYDMTKMGCDGGNYYMVEIPVAYKDFKFVRLNPATTENNWNDGTKWNETGNLKVPTDNNVLFTVTNWGDGSWGAYSAPQYAITITNGTGGTVTVQQGANTITSGNKVNLNAVITATLAANDGYSKGTAKIKIGDNAEADLVEGQEYTICGPTTISATWKPDSHTVKFDANGHGTAPKTQTVDHNAKATQPADPTVTGYTFEGWYKEPECTNKWIFNTDVVTTDITLYANWTINSHKVTWNPNGGNWSENTENKEETYNYGVAITSPAQPIRLGYTFAGWSPEVASTMPDKDLTYTAQWTANTNTPYIIEHYKEALNGTYPAEPTETQSLTGTTDTKVTPAVKSYEGFTAPAKQTVTIKADGSLVVTYEYTRNSYQLTWNLDGGEITNEGTAAGQVKFETPLTAPTVEKEGYTFTSWSPEVASTMPAAATTYTAEWTAITYTVTLNQEGAATSGTEKVTATYDAAMPTADVTMPTAQIGYTFMGYFDQKDGKGTQYYDSIGTSAHVWDKVGEATLYAYFKKAEITINLNAASFEPNSATPVIATATLTPTPVGTTSICWELLYNDDTPVAEHDPQETGDPNQVQFNINDLATGTYQIKATLREGTGCEGTIISHTTQVFTITSDHTITIKYVDENGQTIKASTTQSAHVSSLTEITAPPIIGYTFKEWEAGDGVSIKDATDGKKNTATIEYNAYYDGYLKAIYTKNSNIIYFYNTLGWENVYVYFYNGEYWNAQSGTGTQSSWYSSSYKECAQMTRMDESNIWYVDATGKDTKFLVFGKDEQVKYDWFSDTEVIRRGDYNSSLPMFVPIADQTPTELNKYTNTEGKDCVTKYYNKGYWMNYPENTGYTLDLFNHHSDNDPARYFIYPYSKNTIFPLQLEVEINAENVVEGNKKIWFRIHRNDGKNFGGDATNFPTVNPGTTGGFIAENDYKVELITPIAGTYTFILDYTYNEKTKDYQYRIDVDYPAAVGDYRILYRDAAEKTWSGKDKNKEGDEIKWYHPSRVIKKGEDRKDIISFYINTDVQRRLSYQTIKSIDNTTGAITWNTEEVQFNNIDWSKITKSGVYNFTFVQDGKGISVENDIVPYEGNYYIRTDAMAGGWEDYKTNSENRMTYSSFSESDANSFGEKFSHYAVKWCKAGTNVKFTIANDYSQCISDTLAQDIIPLGNLTDEGTLLNNDIYAANIRFMWNWKTNKISRAYVGPAGDKQSQFLMLKACEEIQDAEGNKLNPAEGDILDEENGIYAARFADTQNWIYERTIQVKPRTRVKLYASYPNGYHIYIENNTGWKDVALYAFKSGGEPLGSWPGVQPTRTVEIEGTTYYDFPVNKYVFGSTLIFNNNVKENGEQTSNYTDFATVGEYYLTASSDKKLTKNKYVPTTVEAKAQYFRGEYAEGSCENEHTIQILGGEGETWNKIRVIYDFKTNRLMAAWMPNNNEIDTLSIESDVMIIRDHQNAAQCITFANDSSKLTDVKTVYGVMRFNRWILNNRGGEKNLDIKSCTKVVDNQTVYDPDTTNQYHPILEPANQKSQYERALYFISFPFDVHLSDVFGFGTYGQHWIIEYYDGLKRAKEGYWIDSDPNWKYVTNPTDFVLKAYEGYILCLNLGKMAYDNTDFWAHNISQVELFFPSVTTMEEISKIEVTMPALGEEYLCKINRGDGTEGDRRVKDSYWRCIGVPSYANYSNVLKDEKGETIKWQTSYKTFPFLYKWNMTDNTLTPQSTTNFKFETMHAYLVQNGGEIHWSAVSATPEPASIVARKEAPSNNYEWKLTLSRNEQVEDQAFIRLSNDEKITNNFDFNQDLSKEFNYGRSDIYTLIGYEKAAANSLPISEQTTVIPLGLSIEYNGDYTLAMPDRVNGIGVTLVDNQTGTRTNLSAGMDYTLTLKKGDYNNRFFIEISPVQQTPTDIEYITGDTNGKDTVRKVLIDNILYIVRDGQMFDARGVRVQ